MCRAFSFLVPHFIKGTNMANSMFEQYANQYAKDMFADFDTNNIPSQDEDEEVKNDNPFLQNAEQYAADMFADIDTPNDVEVSVAQEPVQPQTEDQSDFQPGIDAYNEAGGGFLSSVEKGFTRANQSFNAGGAALGDFVVSSLPESVQDSNFGKWLQAEADIDKSDVLRDQEAVRNMPVRPEMKMAIEAANNAESGLDAVYEFAKVINDSPNTVGFIIDQLGEQAPVILTQILGTKGAGALITGSGKMALASRMAAGGGFASFVNTVGSNTGEYMEGDVANFDEAVKKGATRSAAQAGVDALTSAVIPVKFGPSQFTNIPTQLAIQGTGGAAGEYAGATAVGEEASRGELVAEGMLELLGAPGDVISATMSPSGKPSNQDGDTGNTSGETLEDVYSEIAEKELAAAETEKAAATQKPEPAIPDAPTSEAPDIANVEVDINAQRAELDNDLAEVDQGLAAARTAIREEPRTSIPPSSDLQIDTDAVDDTLTNTFDPNDPFADILEAPTGDVSQSEPDALAITADDMAQMDLDDVENQAEIDQEIAAFNASTAAIPTELPPVANKLRPKLPVAPVEEKLTRSQAAKLRGQVDPAKDDLLSAIAKLGGINAEAASKDSFDGDDLKTKSGIRPVFRAGKAGDSLDGMRERLSQDGLNYLDANSTASDLEGLIKQAITGEVVMSPLGVQSQMAKEDQSRLEDLEAQFGPQTEQTPALQAPASALDLDQTLTSALEEARNGGLPQSDIDSILTNYPKESEAVLQLQMSMAGVEIGDSSGSNQTARVGDIRPERDVQQVAGDRGLAGSSTDVATGSSNNESQNVTNEMGVLLSPSVASGNTIANSEAGSGGGINNAGLSGAVDADSSSLENDSAFDLETQTEESLAADTELAATAATEQATKEKTASSRAKADAELGVFKLTGSNAPADVAVANGQDDMFDADSNATGQSTGDPLFSKSAILDSNAKPKGVSKAAIEQRLAVFLDKYKGADNVQVWIRDTQDDAFPGSRDKDGPIKAGYYPEQDAVVFVAENINSLQEIDSTIQHELLVHKGLGLFKKEDVNGLIEVIKENAPKSGPLNKMWEDVKKEYADKPIEKQVEELIAKVAEKKMSKPDKYWNKVVTYIRDMLRNIGFVKEISFSDLRKRVYDMGDAFAQGRRADTREGYESKANDTKSPSLDGLSGSDVLNSKKGGLRPGKPLLEGSNRPDKKVTSKTSDTLGFTTNDKDVDAVIPKVNKGNGKPDITIYGVTAGGQRALVAKPRANGWDITVDRRVTGEMFTDGKPREYTAKNRKQVEERVKMLGLELETVIPETPGNLPPVGGDLLDAAPEWQSKPVERFSFEQFRFKAQDRFINLMKNQEIIEKFAGERLAEDVDAYDAEAVYHGKAESQLSNFKDDVLKPTMKYMVDNDLTIEGVGDYMYALHAKEANAALKPKYEGQPNSDKKSGMTDEDANKILADAKNSGKLDALNEVAQTMYEVVEKSRKILVRSGLQTEEVVQTWRDQYANYVPLWGDPSDPAGAIKFKEETERKGRDSRADNVLVNLIVQHEKVIVRAEKNHVRRTLLKLAEQNPNKDFWRINTPDVVQVLDPVTQLFIDKDAPTKKSEDNVVTVLVDGVQHEITFNERDRGAMNIARSIKNLSVKDMNIFIKGGMMINRWVSATVTQFSPEFLPTNVIRDLQTAIINLAAVENVDNQMIGRIAKNVRKSIKGIREHQKGRKGSEESVWYEEFYNAGAQTGWLDSYETMTARANQLESLMKQNRYMALSTANRFVEYVHDMNTAYENGVRLSTYIELRKAGVSKLKAANAAKNLTVNFNRKGDSALAANALYIFYNAGVQGTAVIARTLTHKKARRMMYALAALSASNEILNRLLSGEDEDGQSAYSKIPHYIRDTNHVFALPDFFGENDVSERWYITIPLSYGYNVISTTANVVAGAGSTLMGNKDYDAADPGIAFTRTLGAFMHGFNPLGGNGSLTQFFSPTVTDNYFQLKDNENFAGNPIMPKDNPFGPQTPDSLKAWESTPEYLKAIMFELNDITGGDEVRSGWFDVSPETVEHWASFLTGSAGRFVKNVFIDLPYKFITDEETSYRDYPFFRKFFKQIGDGTDRENYYRAVNDIEVAGKHRTIGLEKSKEGDDSVLVTVDNGYVNVIKLKVAVQGFKKRIKVYNDSIDLIEDGDLSTKNKRFKIKLLEKKRRSDMMTLVSMYRKAAEKDAALRAED